ncbi:sialoadhesin-like isoform X2 [Ascaphus truei]|uniref:sialoadhesin-like isoform X2 n=1 Tax=Ascaphus truei TaxID=8439 RepID=UPI003F59DD7D
MKLHYSPREKILLLFVLQGAFPGSGCQRWSFSFPRSIAALKGSCVEIPCTFTRPKDIAEISVIWYLYRITGYPQAFNNNTLSAVLPQYRGRTSLLGNVTNSCSLRIDDVRTSDGESYYPGINEEINSYTLNKDSVLIQVTDSPKNTTITLLQSKEIKEGDDVTLMCTSQANPDVNAYTWYKVGNDTQIVLQDHGQHITLRNVSWENEKYYCSAMNDVGRGDSSILKISVMYAAKGVRIIQKPEHLQEDDMELECQFSGSKPAPTHYTWYIDGIPVTNKTGQILYVKPIQSGNYSCAAHNSAGSSSSLRVTITATSGSHKVDMNVILASVAGVIVLILLVLVIYIYIRWKNTQKSTSPSSPESGRIEIKTSAQHMSNQDEIPMDEILYENQQPEQYYNHMSTPNSIRPQQPLAGDSNNLSREEEDALYSTPQRNQKEEPEEVHYASIQHSQRVPSNRVPQRLSHTDNSEYAVVKL